MATTSIKAGNTYTFKNLYSGKMLNLYAGITTNGTNVCQYTADGSDEQKWTFKSDNKLYTYGSSTKCLDRYNSSGALAHNNADIWTNSDDANQKLVFSVSGSYVRIKLSGTSYYLTAYYGTANGGNSDNKVAPGASGNVFWATLGDSEYVSDSGQQLWVATEVETGSGNEEIVVTGMPRISVYESAGYKEYFHPDSGMVNGTWAANGGENIDKKLVSFYKTVFGVEPSSKGKYLYSLYGSKTISSDPKFNLTYHHGVDINYYPGATVHTAHAGKVTKATGNTIAIYDSTENVTYLYLHCAIGVKVNDVLKIGDIIGTQANIGLGYGSDDLETNAHVHLEVRSGKDNTAVYPSAELSVHIPTLNPYNYI